MIFIACRSTVVAFILQPRGLHACGECTKQRSSCGGVAMLLIKSESKLTVFSVDFVPHAHDTV